MTSRRVVCCVEGCFNGTGAPGVSFFCVPKEEQRRQKWIEFLGPSVRLSRSTRLCSKHFTPGEILATGNLNKTAIPSIYPSCSVTEYGYSKSAVSDDGCAEDETDSQNISELIENVKQELCRVCGNRDDCVKSIFENLPSESSYYGVPLVNLLKMYLPLKIQDDDKLPSKICSKCSSMLYQWHELYVTCVAADKAFRNMFCEGKSEGDGEAAVTRLPKNVLQFSFHDESSEDDPAITMTEKITDQLTVHKSDSDSSFYYSVTKEEEKNVEYPEKQIWNISPYACKYCYETFDEKCNLRAHYVSCQESRTLCEQCGKIMPQKRLVKHKSLHHSTKKLCEKCGKSFYPYYLYCHMLSKHSETFTCELCCKIIKTMPSYRQHKIRHQTGQLKTTFKATPVRKGDKIVFVCPVCSLTFDDKRSLVIHLNKPKLVICPLCKVQLNNEKCLHYHSCKKMTCRYCSRNFYNKKSFLGHERIHTGEKPYKCDICDLSFRTVSLRSSHRRTVHNDPAHECTFCSKKFFHASRLRRHMDIHEPVIYLCPLCDKQLKRPDTLLKHIRLHKMGRI